jgi:TatA/E family protein of Tat protein translocase
MLAFIDSPIQILVVIVVLLIVFGPQKLPEMLNQLGRAIREFKKTTSDLSSSLNLEDRYEPHYDPPRYDSYGNHLYNDSARAVVPEEESRQIADASPAPVEPRGDFAASALADTAGDYGVDTSHAYLAEGDHPASAPSGNVAANGAVGVAAKEISVRPAEGAVHRGA